MALGLGVGLGFSSSRSGSDVLLELDLTTSLTPVRGQDAVTFTRTDPAPSDANHVGAGAMQAVSEDEPRFWGARRTENLFADNDWDGTNWDPVGSATLAADGTLTLSGTAGDGFTYAGTDISLAVGDLVWVWFDLENTTNSVVVYTIANNGTATLTLEAGQATFSFNNNSTKRCGALFRCTGAGTFVPKWTQLSVSGDIIISAAMCATARTASDNPPDWVDPATDYGVGITGIKYTATESGNSVDANGDVTLADGAAIPDADLHGILFEPAVTNEKDYSRDFSATYWDTVEATFAEDTGTRGPDGEYGWTLTPTVTSASHVGFDVAAERMSARASSEIMAGAMVEANGYDYVGLSISDADGTKDGEYSIFNLSTGAVESENANHSAYIEDYGNGVYWCQIIMDTTTGSTAHKLTILVSDDGTTGAYAGDGSSGVIVYGHMVAEYDAPTSYIDTDGAAATKAEENLDIDIAAHPANNFTWIVEFTPLVADLTRYILRAFMPDNGSGAAQYMLLWCDGGSTIRVQKRQNDPIEVENHQTGVVIDAFTTYKIAIRQTPSGLSTSVNGGSVVSSTTGVYKDDIPEILTMSCKGVGTYQSRLGSLKIHKRALSDAEMQAATS